MTKTMTRNERIANAAIWIGAFAFTAGFWIGTAYAIWRLT